MAILFDLDGTLADTAPDLAEAINLMRLKRSLSPIPLESIRAVASAGTRGLFKIAFNISTADPSFLPMREEFFANYEKAICVKTSLFPKIQHILAQLTFKNIQWGIVTNKIARLSEPLIKKLELTQSAACVVSGDTTSFMKPNPAPLLYAAKLINTAPSDIIYVGDDLRDIVAGHAAGMRTIAAAYGYCGNALPPSEWKANWVASSTEELMSILEESTKNKFTSLF